MMLEKKLTKPQLPILISLILVALFAAAMELGFRAWLFSEYGKSSIIAGSLPNFVAVLLISLIYKMIKGEKPDASPLKMSLMGSGVMIFYECIQPSIQGRTFDWFDILASILAGFFVFVLLTMIERFPRR